MDHQELCKRLQNIFTLYSMFLPVHVRVKHSLHTSSCVFAMVKIEMMLSMGFFSAWAIGGFSQIVQSFLLTSKDFGFGLNFQVHFDKIIGTCLFIGLWWAEKTVDKAVWYVDCCAEYMHTFKLCSTNNYLSALSWTFMCSYPCVCQLHKKIA